MQNHDTGAVNVMTRTIEDISQRIRRVCVKWPYGVQKIPSTSSLALSVALLVLGVVLVGLVVGFVCTGSFRHYTDMLTNLSRAPS